MSTNMTTTTDGAMVASSDIFSIEASKGDLTGGGRDSFSILSIRGGRFHVKHEGDEQPLLDEQGVPRSSIEVVMINARGNHSRNYYPGDYVEGENMAPSCWSMDGITPDEGAEDKQAESCASCPMSKWGSAISKASSKKIMACQTYRRVAVTPAEDILNEAYGGAMLLRVPGSSLKHLDRHGKSIEQRNVSYREIVTRLSFDPAASYPLLVFTPVRRITDEEKAQVLAVYPSSAAVLETEVVEPAAAAPAPVPGDDLLSEFDANEQATAGATPSPAAPAPTAPAPKAKAAKAKAPAPAPVPPKSNGETSDLDSELDNILGELDL